MCAEGVTHIVSKESAVQHTGLFHLSVSQELSGNKTSPGKWLVFVIVAFCC